MPQTDKGPLFSPLHWQILLWYYARPQRYAEHEPAHADSGAVFDYTQELCNEGLIFPTGDRAYKVTSRGKFLVEHILTLPLPTQVWTMPD